MRSLIKSLGAMLAIAASLFVSSPAQAGDIGHDQVWAIGAIADDLGWKYLPHVTRPTTVFGWKSCSPFPAVNWEGQTSGGLHNSGAYNAGCDKANKGANTYYQKATYGNYCAIVYAWYFPKDSTAHRHDWESLVVFLDGTCENSPMNHNVKKWCASAHGGYTCKAINAKRSSGPSVAVTWTDNPLSFGLSLNASGGSWHNPVYFPWLPSGVQDALNNKDWGSANLPVGKNFWSNVNKAWKK